MQFMFVISFILVLIAGVTSNAQKAAEVVEMEAGTLARQMGSWHHAATLACAANACGPGGRIGDTTAELNAVRGYLPLALRNQGIYTSGVIESRYDDINRVVVTTLAANVNVRFNNGGDSSISFGSVAAAMRVQGMTGQSSYAGIWANGRVNTLRHHSMANAEVTLPYTIGSAITAGLPSGTPILVGKL